MKLKPSDIALPANGLFTRTLGKAEPEAVAVVIVRYHQEKALEDWTPISIKDFIDFYYADEYCERIRENPILARCFLHGLAAIQEGGFLAGWIRGEPESLGTVAEKFVDAIAGSHWDLTAREVTP